MFSKCNCSSDSETKTYTYTKEELEDIIDFLYNNQIQVHCHCIGNLAARMVIDALEKAKNKFGIKENAFKHYMAHLQLVSPEDITRMKKLDIGGNMSPFWFKKDYFADTLIEMIGDDRLTEVYPIRKLIDNGVTLGFGSDWPVSTLSPLEGIEVALTHRELGESEDKFSFNPDNQINIFQALRAYTIGSAEILGLQNVCGSIEVGKLADFIVLDKNIFKIQPWLIHSANVDILLLVEN